MPSLSRPPKWYTPPPSSLAPFPTGKPNFCKSFLPTGEAEGEGSEEKIRLGRGKGCGLPQFLLPMSPLQDRALPRLVLQSLLVSHSLPLCRTEARLCKEVTLHRQTQGGLKSGQSGSIPSRDIWAQVRVWDSSSWRVKPWTRGVGQAHSLCPLRRQLLLPACGLNSWTHCWGPGSGPGVAC